MENVNTIDRNAIKKILDALHLAKAHYNLAIAMVQGLPTGLHMDILERMLKNLFCYMDIVVGKMEFDAKMIAKCPSDRLEQCVLDLLENKFSACIANVHSCYFKEREYMAIHVTGVDMKGIELLIRLVRQYGFEVKVFLNVASQGGGIGFEIC